MFKAFFCALVSLHFIAAVYLISGCGDEGEKTSKAIFVEYEELKAWIELKEDMVLIDVRRPDEFAAGHLQDAINIDIEDLIDQQGNLINNGSALTSVVEDKSEKIVAYCFGYGKDKDFADVAGDLGYTNVYRYEGGTNDWSQHGNYFVIEYEAFKKWHKAKYPFDDNENFLIDVLPVDWYTGDDPSHPGGHIPGAINIPIEEWVNSDGSLIDSGNAFTTIITDKDATVVIYCGNWSCGKSLLGVKGAVALEYTKVYRYQGGWEEWKNEGNELNPGEEP
jgi:rhodanese-related sulfurtransferase